MTVFHEHRKLMVDHFLWLEERDPVYATWALDQYRKDPNCPCPDILADIKAEKQRRRSSVEPRKTGG